MVIKKKDKLFTQQSQPSSIENKPKKSHQDTKTFEKRIKEIYSNIYMKIEKSDQKQDIDCLV